MIICDFGLKIGRGTDSIEPSVLSVMQMTLQIEHARNNFSKFTEFNKLVGGQVTWSPVMGWRIFWSSTHELCTQQTDFCRI